MEDIIKFGKTIISSLLPFFGIIVALLLYYLLFVIINKVDPNIFNRYASDGIYEYNPYFNDEINEQTSVYFSLNTFFENRTVENQREIYKTIVDDFDKFEQIIRENELYMQYLQENSLSVEGLLKYSQRYVDLDYAVVFPSFFIVTIIIIWIYSEVLKYRIQVYVVGAVAYILMRMSDFSSGLSGITIVTLMTKVDKSIDFSDYYTSLESVAPILLEALLAYIILDAIISGRRSIRKRMNLSLFRRFYFNIIELNEWFKSNQGEYKSIRHIKFNYSFEYLLKYFRKNKKKKCYDEFYSILLQTVNYKGEILVDSDVFRTNIAQIYYLMTTEVDFQGIIENFT